MSKKKQNEGLTVILEIDLPTTKRGGSADGVQCLGGDLIECGVERWILTRGRLRGPIPPSLADEEVVLHCQANEPGVVGIVRRANGQIVLFLTTNGGALYFKRTSTGERFRFADTPKQLVDTDEEPLDAVYVASAIRNHPSRRPPHSSLYAAIKRIPPGAKCVLNKRGENISVSWWRDVPTSATLREAFVKTLSLLVEGKETHVLLSGGLDSANIVAGLKLLGTEFTAHHFVTSADAHANAIEQSKFLGVELIVHQHNKRAIDFSVPLEKAKVGVLSGTRPRLRRSIPGVNLSDSRTVVLNGQNADALLSIHDYTLPRKMPTSLGALKKDIIPILGRILLTDAAIRSIATLGPQARRRYLAGLLMPGPDVCVPIFPLDPDVNEAKKLWESIETQYFPDGSSVPLRSFDVKAARWLEYASHASEGAWLSGIRYPYSSGLMFPHMLQAPLGGRSVLRPKWTALELYRDLTGVSYESVAITGHRKFSEGEGVPENMRLEREGLLEGLSFVEFEHLLDRLDTRWTQDTVASRRRTLNAKAREGKVSGKDLDSVGALVALSACSGP